LEGGLAAYGEGPKYAQQVVGRIKGGGSVQLAQAPEVQAVAPTQVVARELPSLTPDAVPMAQMPIDMEWRQLQQAMPAKPIQVADMDYGAEFGSMAIPQFNMPAFTPTKRTMPDFNRFKGWGGRA
jgi:hypothetical protein